MFLISLMASTHNGCPPGLAFVQEQPFSRPFKDIPQLVPTIGLRQEAVRSGILSLTPHEHDDLYKSMSGLDGYSQIFRTAPIRRIPLLGGEQDKQPDYTLFSIDEQWRKHKKLLPFVMSGSNELEKDFIDPSIYPDLLGSQASPADMHLLHFASTDFEFNNCSRANRSLLHPSENYYDLEVKSDLVHDHDLPSSALLIDADGRVCFVGTTTDMKDGVSVLEEFKYTKEPAWRKQEVVPYFRWKNAVKVQDPTYFSPLKLESLSAAPLKSHERVKQKPSLKRKSKTAVKDRDLYKNNSLQACEILLSIMMDKRRNGKSVMNSVKKAGSVLPLLLTQFSASLTGTGLAVMFSVIHKVIYGSIPFCTSNLLTSGFGVGLFWLSSAVNRLRDTITCLGKYSVKLEFEEEIMMRVDKSVNDIFFRAAALMVVLIFRFA